MKLYRTSVPAALLAGALALTACGSDNNTTSAPAEGTSPGAATTAPTGASPTDTGTGGTGGGAVTCATGTLKSSGSTAQQNAMEQWIKDYQAKCPGTTINYGGGGSGQGITDFTNGQTDFAGTDAALDPTKGEVRAATKRCGSQAINLPMVTGPIAVGYHLTGVSDLTLNADVIAKIFTGKIKTWNDPAIKALNPSATLPSTPISVLYRSDQSGTTQNFESYLQASAPSVWTATPSKTWAGTGQGKKGNPLLGQAVQATNGSIGYVEWSYAVQNDLTIAKVDNGSGPVTLTADTVGKTVDTAQVTPSGPGDLTLKLNYATKTPGAYPILLVTYEVVCTKYANAQIGALVKSFMSYISSNAAQNSIHQLGYAALPTGVAQKVQAQIQHIS